MSQEEIARIGSDTAARTLFYGGLVFAAFGVMERRGWTELLPVKEEGYVLMGMFMAGIALPAFIFSWRQVKRAKRTAEAANSV